MHAEPHSTPAALTSRTEPVAAPGSLRYSVHGVVACVLLVALLDLVGWDRHVAWLVLIRPGFATMNPSTALGLLLLAGSLWLKRERRTAVGPFERVFSAAADVLAYLVLALGLVTLIEHAAHVDYALDGFFRRTPLLAQNISADRTSVGTAIAFGLLSLSLLALDRSRITSAISCFLACLLSLLALVGFVFNAGQMFGVPLIRSSAVHAAVALLLLGLAVFAARPQYEPLCSIVQSGRHHLTRNWFFFGTVVLPFVVSFPILITLRHGWYDAASSFALLVVLLIAMQSLLIWRNSHSLMQLESQRLHAEQALMQNEKLAESALIQSEKLAAVGRMASSIAHEINNPLESVTNLLYLARTSEDIVQIQDFLETAERELRRAAVITNRTLQFNRQSTHPTTVTADDMFDGILTIHHGRIVNARIAVESTRRDDTPIECYDTEIRQVLGNLISNAIDAMHPTGGRLLLRSRAVTDRSTGRRGVLITVADTGPGMDRATAARVFDAFFTTKGIGGTGLGLWISREIVDRHQGRLRLRTGQRPSRSGTVFTLFLPCQAAQR